jgi:anhydro-N-acetylmuramic acid kinase
MSAYYIGLMSGTSVDGIHAVVVDLAADEPHLLAAQTIDWDPALRNRILATVNHPTEVSLESLGQLDAALGETFADAALAITRAAGLQPAEISGLGSHGQTLFHAASAMPPITMQAA